MFIIPNMLIELCAIVTGHFKRGHSEYEQIEHVHSERDQIERGQFELWPKRKWLF